MPTLNRNKNVAPAVLAMRSKDALDTAEAIEKYTQEKKKLDNQLAGGVSEPPPALVEGGPEGAAGALPVIEGVEHLAARGEGETSGRAPAKEGREGPARSVSRVARSETATRALFARAPARAERDAAIARGPQAARGRRAERRRE